VSILLLNKICSLLPCGLLGTVPGEELAGQQTLDSCGGWFVPNPVILIDGEHPGAPVSWQNRGWDVSSQATML